MPFCGISTRVYSSDRFGMLVETVRSMAQLCISSRSTNLRYVWPVKTYIQLMTKNQGYIVTCSNHSLWLYTINARPIARLDLALGMCMNLGIRVTPLSANLVTPRRSTLNSIPLLASMSDWASQRHSIGPIRHGPSKPARSAHKITLDLAVNVGTWPFFATHGPPFGHHTLHTTFYHFNGSLYTSTLCSISSRCLIIKTYRVTS